MGCECQYTYLSCLQPYERIRALERGTGECLDCLPQTVFEIAQLDQTESPHNDRVDRSRAPLLPARPAPSKKTSDETGRPPRAAGALGWAAIRYEGSSATGNRPARRGHPDNSASVNNPHDRSFVGAQYYRPSAHRHDHPIQSPGRDTIPYSCRGSSRLYPTSTKHWNYITRPSRYSGRLFFILLQSKLQYSRPAFHTKEGG
ncbi:uncharacterized protein CLUP02_00252 [Colletotrichum lupini]|uniref:Uncharacterized protein n=1 Tax=Colletotrichum lupini TaxID=145971 RepID=A0A9Q8SBS8_9PEZI|nr:uncharacterized protein CLUP02_00252 [Colletotrichum lupini]UQC73607.1 hypothetical protein CLUP02_00252 [Colletotrichum lupini]